MTLIVDVIMIVKGGHIIIITLVDTIHLHQIGIVVRVILVIGIGQGYALLHVADLTHNHHILLVPEMETIKTDMIIGMITGVRPIIEIGVIAIIGMKVMDVIMKVNVALRHHKERLDITVICHNQRSLGSAIIINRILGTPET